MRAEHCLFCPSQEKVIQNGLVSTKVDGAQVEFFLCPKHRGRLSEAWRRTGRRIVRLENAVLAGRKFPEETCLLCNGSGQLMSGVCWWCKGTGKVRPKLGVLETQIETILGKKRQSTY